MSAPSVSNPNNVRGLEVVAAICERYGLVRLTEPGMHQEAWTTEARSIAVTVASFAGQMTGVCVQRIRDWETGDAEEFATIQPRTEYSSALLRAALSTVLPDE